MGSEQTTVAKDIDQLSINTLRFLAVDMTNKAGSGHPGMPMGAAPMAYVLWTKFLHFNPQNPKWYNRDRFVLSAGHGSALQYALLHLTGYDLPMEELKQLRQWGSRTPGHPEYGHTAGIEATTGPLGQGFSNAVGMAIAEKALAARYNKPGYNVVDHFTYVIASDGDLMEGISSEAGSLAGHLGLGKLIVLYDNNHISIEGNTDITFTEDRRKRFDAFHWHTASIEDGNDLPAIEKAIYEAREEHGRPSFIEIRTHIGYGSPNMQDTGEAHGSALGEEEARLTKKNLGWPEDKQFYVPDEVYRHFRQIGDYGQVREDTWSELYEEYQKKYTKDASTLKRVLDQRLPDDWDEDLPVFTSDDGPVATRSASGKVLNVLAKNIPEIFGGSGDLAGSNKSGIKDGGDFDADTPEGRNMHFGVREHVMGGILNGLALHGGLLPFGATFLIFSDYMRPPMRLAAMSKLHVIYMFTHDSIGLGGDGPTHQPVEQLVGLRAIPGMTVIRPADANETREAWKVAVTHKDGPVALILTRQKIPVIDPGEYENIGKGFDRGGYLLYQTDESKNPDIILTATGSEVPLSLEGAKKLERDGLIIRVVSLPAWNLFKKQDNAYQQKLFPAGVPVLAIEAGGSLGWKPYLGDGIATISVDRFGASAPGETVMEKYGFTVDNVYNQAKSILSNA